MGARKSSRMSAQRRRAAEAAAEAAARFQEREQRLVELATDVMACTEQLDNIAHQYEVRRVELAAAQRNEEREVRARASRAAHAMLEDHGASKRETCERLQVSAKELNELLAVRVDDETDTDQGDEQDTDQGENGPRLVG